MKSELVLLESRVTFVEKDILLLQKIVSNLSEKQEDFEFRVLKLKQEVNTAINNQEVLKKDFDESKTNFGVLKEDFLKVKSKVEMLYNLLKDNLIGESNVPC